MGLDTVELAMEVEESFGITIPDSRACEMRTVGDLYSFILEETRDQQRDPNSCLSAATFYALRRRLMSHIENASSIRPRTEIAATIPIGSRRLIWSRLANDMDLRFPSLRRPSWLTLLATVAVFISGMLSFSYFKPITGTGLATILAMLTLALATLVSMLATSPFALYPGATFSTYRGLVTQLMALNYAKLSDRHNSWNATDVWNVLQLIIVEQLGVKREDVTPNANFVYDLGCD